MAIQIFLRLFLTVIGGAFVIGSFLYSIPTLGASKDILQAIVGIEAKISNDARTARILGTQRQGNGIVIDNEGLIVTIGYLILEATNIKITHHDGTRTSAEHVAYDHESGLGLIRIPSNINIKPLRLGNSSQISQNDKAIILAHSSEYPISGVQVVSRRVFTGYWEYMLENAIFTSPPHSYHSGAALVGEDGKLLGVGSLLVNDAATPNVLLPGNMFVPIDELKPILADLLQHGRRTGQKRPWIGANTFETNGRIFVSRITKNGPADQAGLSIGDLIVGVNGISIGNHADFYRKLWSSGKPGQFITLNIIPQQLKKLQIQELKIRSGDRSKWLKIKRSF
jgi:S1-C subfamily serine protease